MGPGVGLSSVTELLDDSRALPSNLRLQELTFPFKLLPLLTVPWCNFFKSDTVTVIQKFNLLLSRSKWNHEGCDTQDGCWVQPGLCVCVINRRLSAGLGELCQLRMAVPATNRLLLTPPHLPLSEQGATTPLKAPGISSLPEISAHLSLFNYNGQIICS